MLKFLLVWQHMKLHIIRNGDEDLGLNTGRVMIAGSILEYDEQYFSLSFIIA